MNKPYIAKYLPVEGEESGLPFGSTTYYGMPFKNTGQYIGNFIEERDDYDMYQTLKLFLCSRDIQIGDKVRFSHKTGLPEKELIVRSIDKDTVILADGKYMIHTNPDKLVYKVMGEISLNATWVKEGDEFDEGEIAWKCDCGCGKPYTINDIRKNLEPYTDEVELPKGIYFILGPCGHFH